MNQIHIDADTIFIPSSLINKFLSLRYDRSPEEVLLHNPEQTLRNIIRNARNIEANYYIDNNFVFQIINKVLEDIFIIPIITIHARERILERFEIDEDDMLLNVALGTAKGYILSQKERCKLRILVEKNSSAIRFEKYVYILNRKHVLITALLIS